MTPILRELHWLPVESRIHFKIMVLVHRAVHDTGPAFCRSFSTCIDLGGHCALSLTGCLLDQERDQEPEMQNLYQQQLICGIPCH